MFTSLQLIFSYRFYFASGVPTVCISPVFSALGVFPRVQGRFVGLSVHLDAYFYSGGGVRKTKSPKPKESKKYIITVDHTSEFPVPFIISKIDTTNPMTVTTKIPFIIA
jgi:hypothetical protein